MITNKHVKRFNLVAREYNTERYPGRSQCMQTVLGLLNPQVEDIVLDVGCGPGTQLVTISNLIKHGYGIDPAERMIGQAQQTAAGKYHNIEFYVGSAELLPPEMYQANINKIFSNYALHHLSDDMKWKSIQNLASLLPRNGVMILGDLIFSDDPNQYEDLFDIVGYGPTCDTPAQLPLIENMFIMAGFSPRIHILNPLVAVVEGRKT
jgi:SAM-dependent methyltransferase